jgi:hypothetical protein
MNLKSKTWIKIVHLRPSPVLRLYADSENGKNKAQRGFRSSGGPRCLQLLLNETLLAPIQSCDCRENEFYTNSSNRMKENTPTDTRQDGRNLTQRKEERICAGCLNSQQAESQVHACWCTFRLMRISSKSMKLRAPNVRPKSTSYGLMSPNRGQNPKPTDQNQHTTE